LSPKEEEGFRGVSLKKELVDAVEKFIQDHPDAGYKNISEFVHDAVRRRREEIARLYESTLGEGSQ